MEVKEKVDLNKVSYSVRASQAVLQYGVGAMVDFQDQTLVTAAPEVWNKIRKIYDDRFAKALGVDYFGSPENIAYDRFPQWYFCPKCRKFQPLSKWQQEYREKAKKGDLEYDPHMINHMQCPKCHQDLVVSRIVTVCENGHLNDFPWVEWVHTKDHKPICASPVLEFKTGASGTEGLEGLNVRCRTCHASATLKGAFDKDAFQEMDEKSGRKDFICPGNHPFKHAKEKCGCYPRTVQRGASSVYFPLTFSSLVIPPYADKINKKIEESKEFETCCTRINIYEEDYEESEVIEKIKAKLSSWAENISREIGAPASEVIKVLNRKWLTDSDEDITDVTSFKYKLEEYHALNGTAPTSPENFIGDFSREEMDLSDYGIPYLKSIVLIDKVRVVNALVGFSRLNPVSRIDEQGCVCVKENETRWYPAYEVKGEGIFIEFDQDAINRWVESNPKVQERCARLQQNYDNSFLESGYPKNITPKFVMLHTLSHLLISQLSFECGYSIASLSERLYCYNGNKEESMAGIFIYTASGDSEGTLGGLVRQGRPDAFPRIFQKALEKAKTCSNDPVCIMSKGQGRDSLNLAACHACTLLPETCCEERNEFLDRGLIIGTFEDKSVGFWSNLIWKDGNTNA